MPSVPGVLLWALPSARLESRERLRIPPLFLHQLPLRHPNIRWQNNAGRFPPALLASNMNGSLTERIANALLSADEV